MGFYSRESKASYGSNGVTVVARNMEFWFTQIQAHTEGGTPKEQILSSFPTLLKGISSFADASAESLRMAARSSAL